MVKALGSIVVCIAWSIGVMAQTPPRIERHYDAAKNETSYRFIEKLEVRKNGELDLFGRFTFPGARRSAPVEQFRLALMWIGLERIFSTPAIAAVEVDGREIYKELGEHGIDIDGNTVDESVAFDVPAAVVTAMAEGERVVVRIDDLRMPLTPSHVRALRELLRLATGAE